MEKWYDFDMEELTICGQKARIVYPDKSKANGKYVFKTEYFGAFPNAEIDLVKEGYHLVGCDTISRWYSPKDTDIKAEFVKYLVNNLGLNPKGVYVGMSCGGMEAIYFAVKYPQYVSVLYLDAPVINFLSCPAGLGKTVEKGMMAEFVEKTGITLEKLLYFRDHPLDNLDKLISLRIPTLLIAGDSDTIVPYDENGIFVYEAYSKTSIPFKAIIKKGGDHHPHGLEDTKPIIDFIKEYDKQI